MAMNSSYADCGGCRRSEADAGAKCFPWFLLPENISVRLADLLSAVPESSCCSCKRSLKASIRCCVASRRRRRLPHADGVHRGRPWLASPRHFLNLAALSPHVKVSHGAPCRREKRKLSLRMRVAEVDRGNRCGRGFILRLRLWRHPDVTRGAVERGVILTFMNSTEMFVARPLNHKPRPLNHKPRPLSPNPAH